MAPTNIAKPEDQTKPVVHEPVPINTPVATAEENNIHQLRYRNGFNEGMPEHCNIYGSQDRDVSTTEEATIDAEQESEDIILGIRLAEGAKRSILHSRFSIDERKNSYSNHRCGDDDRHEMGRNKSRRNAPMTEPASASKRSAAVVSPDINSLTS